MFKFLQRNPVKGGMQYWVDIHGGEYMMIIRDGKPAESSFAEGCNTYNQLFDFLVSGGYL
ncbi:hypothetical protein [Salmonella phage SE13]|uniref:Uncharacterized protein n=1 Tax=Salmonella phage SE13 TaxID=2575325 RepID=A0A513ZWQ2_9CAUD|nr:hypothetical protein HWC19_gp05 [Salmonella phage SE13]QDH45111.1 hypothetical protein [Salmonella phage SE13]